jgi:pimeloyl-ACP methyl ester carboxylesterase
MPRVEVPGATINYEEHGRGEPLLLIPCLAADSSCWAFQVPAYSARFRCIVVDLPGSGGSPTPVGTPSTDRFADELAALLDALGVEAAHVAGVSLGAAVGMQLAGRHPERVLTLGLHSAWAATDAFMAACMESWRALAPALPTMADFVACGVFPWAFTPEMYAARPEVIREFTEIVRARGALSVEGFMAQSRAVLDHDASAVLDRISAPTMITYGARDVLTSTRFAPALVDGIADARLVVFDHLSHAGFNEDPDTFTAATLDFMGGAGAG